MKKLFTIGLLIFCCFSAIQATPKKQKKEITRETLAPTSVKSFIKSRLLHAFPVAQLLKIPTILSTRGSEKLIRTSLATTSTLWIGWRIYSLWKNNPNLPKAKLFEKIKKYTQHYGMAAISAALELLIAYGFINLGGQILLDVLDMVL